MTEADARIVADTRKAMDLIERVLPATLAQADAAVQAQAENALLNVAVARILEIEGPTRTATILWRLADAVATHRPPDDEHAIDLTRRDA